MNINITLIGQMITFALFVWFTMKLVWPPVMRALDERKKKIAEGLASADRAEHELKIARHKAREIIREARSQASVILDHANQRAHRIEEDAQLDARNAAAKMRSQAQQEIERQLLSTREALRGQVADLAIQGAEKLLNREIDRSANQALLNELMAEIES